MKIFMTYHYRRMQTTKQQQQQNRKAMIKREKQKLKQRNLLSWS